MYEYNTEFVSMAMKNRSLIQRHIDVNSELKVLKTGFKQMESLSSKQF